MKILLTLLLLVLVQNLRAQSISEDLGLNYASGRSQTPFKETLLLIGNSRKILILSNNANYLQKGDFITILYNKRAALRALVGKTRNSKAGVKVLKTFSLEAFDKIKKGDQVEIVIGDYTYKPQEEADDKDDLDSLGINDEGDLFNNSVDINIEEEADRNINTQNIVYFSWGPFSGDAPLNQVQQGEISSVGAFLDDRGSQTYNDYSIGWARQVSDNIFAEGLVDIVTLNGFPSPDISALLLSFAVRIKYAYKLPAYFYALPYIE